MKQGKVIPVKFDPVFKAIFQNPKLKNLIAYTLSNIIPLNQSYIYENMSFKNTELPKEKTKEKQKVTDLIIEVKGNILNLEMNKDNDKGTFYKNNVYHHKLAYETIYKNESYEDNRQIIQINFDCINKFDDRLVIKFMVRDDDGKFILDERYINYHINMAKVLEKRYNKEKLSRFEKILLMMQLEDKKELREIAKGDEELMEMERIIEDMSEDNEIIGLYDKEKMDALVEKINLEEAKKEGTKQGFEQGTKQGIEQGKIISNKETAKKMLDKNMDIDIISEVIGLSKEEIESLK